MDDNNLITVEACEGELASLHCPPQHQILVHLANFGRFTLKKCNPTYRADISTACQNNQTIEVLKASCNHRSRCSFRASTEMFGDKCPGTSKYLEAHYSCLLVEVTTTTTTTPSTTVSLITTSLALPSSSGNLPFDGGGAQDLEISEKGYGGIGLLLLLSLFLLLLCYCCLFLRCCYQNEEEGKKKAARQEAAITTSGHHHHRYFPTPRLVSSHRSQSSLVAGCCENKFVPPNASPSTSSSSAPNNSGSGVVTFNNKGKNGGEECANNKNIDSGDGIIIACGNNKASSSNSPLSFGERHQQRILQQNNHPPPTPAPLMQLYQEHKMKQSCCAAIDEYATIPYEEVGSSIPLQMVPPPTIPCCSPPDRFNFSYGAIRRSIIGGTQGSEQQHSRLVCLGLVPCEQKLQPRQHSPHLYSPSAANRISPSARQHLLTEEFEPSLVHHFRHHSSSGSLRSAGIGVGGTCNSTTVLRMDFSRPMPLFSEQIENTEFFDDE